MFGYQSPITAQFCGSLNDEMIKFSEDTALTEIKEAIGYNIDKEELIKALVYDRHQYEKGYQDGKAEAKLETGWISVKERLPEKETPNCTVDVLVTDGTHINIGYYDYTAGMWWTLEDCFYFHVTHWMPLPEPPTLEGDE